MAEEYLAFTLTPRAEQTPSVATNTTWKLQGFIANAVTVMFTSVTPWTLLTCSLRYCSQVEHVASTCKTFVQLQVHLFSGCTS